MVRIDDLRGAQREIHGVGPFLVCQLYSTDKAVQIPAQTFQNFLVSGMKSFVETFENNFGVSLGFDISRRSSLLCTLPCPKAHAYCRQVEKFNT